MTDPVYPIYRISAEWVQNGDTADYAEYGADHWAIRDLPEGRVRNRTGFDVMRKVRDDEGEVIKTEEWFARYRAKKEGNGEWSDVHLTSAFVREESWCLLWFSHYTFDDGRDNGAYLASFERFVNRMKRLNDEARGKWDGIGYFSEPYCLMGAEDTWRWSAHADDDSRLPPPCRCEHCKAQGIVRIDH